MRDFGAFLGKIYESDVRASLFLFFGVVVGLV